MPKVILMYRTAKGYNPFTGSYDEWTTGEDYDWTTGRNVAALMAQSGGYITRLVPIR